MDKIMFLVLICATVTGLITEAIKKMISDKNTTLLAAGVSVLVAGGLCAGYIVLNNVDVTRETIVYVVCVVILSWLSATLGFDKVKQALGGFGK